MTAGGGAFIVTAGKLQGVAVADLLARALPKTIRIWMTRARPFIAAVAASGDVQMRDGGARRASIRRDTSE
jgi:hypothetical protein